MSRKVRVRFAPSPTGPLHIGGIRTALFNYLYARKHGGDFILRIEDTDQSRYVSDAEQYIINSLNWCGIPYDEGPDKPGKYGPYRQSERKHLYVTYARQLVENGMAYYAFDTPETLDNHRKDHESKGKTFIYNWHNRQKLRNSLSLSAQETQSLLDSSIDYVIRFKSPRDETLHLVDIIRGGITIDTNVLDDKVLFKSDGMPTYHLANIVDDHLMEITHVIRGEEWLPSLALHYQLYKAFDWEAPQFAHLPLILKPEGKGKLSKRDGEKLGFPVFPLAWETTEGYRETGYFPEAVINFLAMLGWNPGTGQELFTLHELTKSFSLDRVHKAGARFDPDKTKWYNQQYLQRYPLFELTALYIPMLLEKGLDPGIARLDHNYVSAVISLIRERATFIADFWEVGAYFFVAPLQYEEGAVKKHWKPETSSILEKIQNLLDGLEDFSAVTMEASVKDWIQSTGMSFGKVMAPLRLAIVGSLMGPHIFDVMALLGKQESLGRVAQARAVLDGHRDE